MNCLSSLRKEENMGKDLNGRELGVGLYQRKDGRYEAKATVDGVKINLYDNNLAKLKASFKEAKENISLTIAQKYSRITLDEWFEQWFDTYKAPYIKPASIFPMKSKYNNTFGRLLGKMQIQKIMNVHVQDAVTVLAKEGRATSSIREALGTVTRCMESARNNRIIEINPCFDIQVPWEKKNVNRRFLTVDEQNSFMKAAENNWYKEMFYVMLHTGLRVGEVGGLKWADVDFENKCINVRQSLSCNYYKGVKKQCLTTLKTQNSYRKIPFIGDMEEMLLSQREKQNALKKELKDRYRSTGEFEDLVFCTSMGSPISRYVAEKEINKVVAAINYEETINAALEHREPEVFEKVYPHALRHTFCSRCFEKGIAPKVVQALMGHAHYSTTIDIYTHVTEDKMGEELEKFQEVMKNQ